MVADLSGLSYFMPIFGFLFVFVIVYALLLKTKILGDNMWINLIISFIIAIIFSVVSSTQEYVQTITPWFAVLVIALFFILVIIGLSPHKLGEIMKPGFVWVFIILLILVFLVSAIKVFPSSFGNAWNSLVGFITNEARIAGAIILLIIAAIAAWVITKK